MSALSPSSPSDLVDVDWCDRRKPSRSGPMRPCTGTVVRRPTTREALQRLHHPDAVCHVCKRPTLVST